MTSCGNSRQVDPAEPPNSFTGTLRHYQCEGLGWLHFLERFGFGGCLADDMGLGKTVQVLALLAGRRSDHKDRRRRRWSWCRARWSSTGSRRRPASRRICACSTTPASTAASRPTRSTRYDIVLTTYGTLRRDVLLFKDVTFDYCILDEVAGDQEREQRVSQGGPLAQGPTIGWR